MIRGHAFGYPKAEPKVPALRVPVHSGTASGGFKPGTRWRRHEWNTEKCQFIWARSPPEMGPFKRAGLQFDDWRSFAGRCRAALSQIQIAEALQPTSGRCRAWHNSERQSHF